MAGEKEQAEDRDGKGGEDDERDSSVYEENLDRDTNVNTASDDGGGGGDEGHGDDNASNHA